MYVASAHTYDTLVRNVLYVQMLTTLYYMNSPQHYVISYLWMLPQDG